MRVLLIGLVLIGLNASAGTVYRSIDDNGNVRYTDRPEGKNVEQVVLRTSRASNTGSRPSAPAKNATTSPDSGEDPEVEAEQGPSKAEIKAHREGNCKIARERLDRYVTSHRLYKALPDGEREYLDDGQLTQARAKAAEDVQEWCN